MGMPRGLVKATAHHNNLAAWADWRKLVAEVTAAGFANLAAEHQPPEGAGWRKMDRASARLKAAFARHQQPGPT